MCLHQERLCANVFLSKQLIEAGVHFGHRASRWNPKMRPYIYGRRNLIHIIDVRETIRGLIRAKKYITRSRGAAAWCCSSAPSGKRPKRSIAKGAAAACPLSAIAGWVVR